MNNTLNMCKLRLVHLFSVNLFQTMFKGDLIHIFSRPMTTQCVILFTDLRLKYGKVEISIVCISDFKIMRKFRLCLECQNYDLCNLMYMYIMTIITDS